MPADQVTELVGRLAGARGCQLVRREVWLAVHPPGGQLPAHGWKLHVSARPVNYPELVELIVPVLLDAGVVFKLAASIEDLRRLNSGDDSPAAVGKAVTVYPPAEQAVELGRQLADLLRGRPGPRILSDRRLDPDAPVYYRYGPFTADRQADRQGRLITTITGPDGQTFAALAGLRYRQPDWLADPFRAGAAEPSEIPSRGQDDSPPQRIVAGRYRVIEGIQRSVRGSVFRAESVTDGRPVILKQARAYVGEDTGEVDARLRLRNERRILQLLESIEGVPRFIDHLSLGSDELLVISDLGSRNLISDLGEQGRYRSDGTGRSLALLARNLAVILRGIHQRGVIMRDLAPKNVIVADGSVSIVDFGIAAHGEVAIEGATPGYAPPTQQRRLAPQATDDCFALGMTLIFALTGSDPMVAGDDPEWSRIRAIQTLRNLDGGPSQPLIGTIADLLSADPATALTALAELAGGAEHRFAGWAAPATPPVDTGLAEAIIASLRVRLVERLRVELAGPADRLDPSMHSGLAGIGMELLHHLDQPGVAVLVGELARVTVRLTSQLGLPPGLRLGTTGIQLFGHAVRRAGIDCPDLDPGLVEADLYDAPSGADLMIGAAGVGLGHLRLFDYDGDDRHLIRAVSCARMLLDADDLDAARSDDAAPPERTGVVPAAGLAHGRAGTVLLLAELAATDPAGEFADISRKKSAELATEATALAVLAGRSTARPLAASWCQGLAGIARALHTAGQLLDEPDLVRVAGELADRCLAWVPLLSTAGQCCGLAGIGSMLITVAPARYGAAGHPDGGGAQVAGQLLRRSAGVATEPVFDRAGQRPDLSWSTGAAGLLAFFRELRDAGQQPAAVAATARRR